MLCRAGGGCHAMPCRARVGAVSRQLWTPLQGGVLRGEGLPGAGCAGEGLLSVLCCCGHWQLCAPAKAAPHQLMAIATSHRLMAIAAPRQLMAVAAPHQLMAVAAPHRLAAVAALLWQWQPPVMWPQQRQPICGVMWDSISTAVHSIPPRQVCTPGQTSTTGPDGPAWPDPCSV